jgi:O-antigen ligase
MLIYRDFKLALYVLLILSILLHKQLFSIYRWDIMPVRLFMVSFMVYVAYRVFRWYRGGGTVSQAVEFFKQPFVLFLVLLWVIRGISIVFSQNLPASLSLYAFFTTVVVLGLFLYRNFSDRPADLLKYLKTYIILTFILSLFAIFQFYTHLTYGWVFGALWAVPDNLPRVGASFWDVNHFGGMLAGILPVIAAFVLISKKLSHRLFYIATFFPVVLALLMTNSRTSWISAAVSFTLLTTILFIRWFRSRGLLAVLVALILVSSPFLIEYNREGSPFRQYVKDYFHYRIDSFDAHFMLLEGSGEIFDRYPYLGGGYGSFFEHFSETEIAAEFFERDPAAFSVRVPAHTIWGELAAETGIAGLLIFSLFVLAGLVPLLYLAFTSKNKEHYFLGAAMSAAVVGWLTAGIFYSYNAEYFWLIFFIYFIYGIGMVGKDKLSTAFTYFIKSEKLAVSLLIGLAFVLIFLNLGKNHFLPWDEAIYSKISKNMVTSGEYVVLSWVPEKIWYEKPPLSLWLMAGSMNLLGFTEYAARLPSAILGLLTILVVYFFGRRFFNRTTGFIAAFVLLTTFNYLYYARAAMLDVSVTFFITLSLYLWWVNKENNSTIALILGGLAAGGAVMTKGVIGFVPFVVIFCTKHTSF